MANRQSTGFGRLVNDAARLVRDVVRQPWSELGHAIQESAPEAGSAALLAGGGVALLGLAGGLSLLAGVHLVERLTGLSRGASYALCAGLAGASGIALLGAAAAYAREAGPPNVSEAASSVARGATQIKEELKTRAR